MHKSDKVIPMLNNAYKLECKTCGHIRKLIVEKNQSFDVEYLKSNCAHIVIKKKINVLFEQVFLGIYCFHHGRFIFEGKKEDRARDYILGFSDRHHRKRTMSSYMLIEEISFKNSYILLSAILEEVFELIKFYSQENCVIPHKMDYKSFVFRKSENNILKNSKRIRFFRIADGVRQIANILKHTGGIVKNNGSGQFLIDLYGFKEGTDLVQMRDFCTIDQIQIGEIPLIVSKLYVFSLDLTAEILNLKNFSVRPTHWHKIFCNLVNCDIREEFIEYLKTVEKDGSVRF